MWLHRMDVILQSIMSGHNNMLYKYYSNCSGIYTHACTVCDAMVASYATTESD